MRDHKAVRHPREFLRRPTTGMGKLNTLLAVGITKAVGSMWCAYIFILLDLLELGPVIHANSMITWVTYISQTVLQLILLPIIMVGQNVIQSQNNAKADADHQTLTYLATLQDQQMTELKGITMVLEALKRRDK
ncbi:MAG TPA: hypothetical protein VGS08_00825 [Candidatus Saccharimonadales bacterium]|nr:hypothetical protein [Candidatus Saccharimonadales bacterium]